MDFTPALKEHVDLPEEVRGDRFGTSKIYLGHGGFQGHDAKSLRWHRRRLYHKPRSQSRKAGPQAAIGAKEQHTRNLRPPTSAARSPSKCEI